MDELKVRITEYEPHVACDPATSESISFKPCELALEDLPSNPRRVIFATERGGGALPSLLPRKKSNGEFFDSAIVCLCVLGTGIPEHSVA